MNEKQHGSLAALILLSSSCVAGYTMYRFGSLFLLIVYILILIIGLAVILFSFCRKCYKQNSTCVHLGIGSLTKLMPSPPEGIYTRTEIAGTVISVIAITAFPQYWLFQNILYLIIFWILTIGAVFQILHCVCTGCANNLCAFCKNNSNTQGGTV